MGKPITELQWQSSYCRFEFERLFTRYGKEMVMRHHQGIRIGLQSRLEKARRFRILPPADPRHQ